MNRPPEPGDFRQPLDEVFSDLVDGRLPPEQRAELRQRLDQDPELRREFERFQHMLAVLHAERSLEFERSEVEPPPDLTVNILTALRDDRGSGRPTGGGRSLLPYLASLFSAAAAVLLFLVLLPHERPHTARDVLRVGEVTVVDESAGVPAVEGKVEQLADGKSRGDESRRALAFDAARPESEREARKQAIELRGGGVAEPEVATNTQPSRKPGEPGWSIPAAGGGGGGKAAVPQGAAKDGPVRGDPAPSASAPGAPAPVRGVAPARQPDAEQRVALLEEEKAVGAAPRQRRAGDGNKGDGDQGDAKKAPVDRAGGEASPPASTAAVRKLDQAPKPASRPGGAEPPTEAKERGELQAQEHRTVADLLRTPNLGYATSDPASATTACLFVVVDDDRVQNALEQSFSALQPQVLAWFPDTPPGELPRAAERTNFASWSRGLAADLRGGFYAGEGPRYLLRLQAPVERVRDSLTRLQSSAPPPQSQVASLDPALSARLAAPEAQWRSYGWPRGEEAATYGERLAQADDLRRASSRDTGVDQFGSDRPIGAQPDPSRAKGQPASDLEQKDKAARAEGARKAEDDPAHKSSLDKERAGEAEKAKEKVRESAPAAEADRHRYALGRTAGATASGPGAASAPAASPGTAVPAAPAGPSTPGPAGPTTGGKPPEVAAPFLKRQVDGPGAPIDFYLVLIYPRAAPPENKARK